MQAFDTFVQTPVLEFHAAYSMEKPFRVELALVNPLEVLVLARFLEANKVH